MKSTTSKKAFDTQSSELLKKITAGSYGDPTGYEETLFLSPDGTYFVYANGGEKSVHPKESFTKITKARALEILACSMVAEKPAKAQKPAKEKAEKAKKNETADTNTVPEKTAAVSETAAKSEKAKKA